MRLGCAPRELGQRLTAIEYHHLLALWTSGTWTEPHP